MSNSRAELDALSATDVREPIEGSLLIKALSASPFVPTRSLINLRDVGAVDGSHIPAGRIYRCGVLDYAAKDPDAVAWLTGNVKRIFDLRTASERESAPEPTFPGIESTWVNGQGSYPSPELPDFARDARAAWKQQYLSVADFYQPIIRTILEHVRDRPQEPFLFHCTAGRDRTGVVGGLLQYLAGTSHDDIVHDYMLSRIGTEPARDKLLAFALARSGAESVETPGFVPLVNLKPEYWNAFEEGLKEEYGGWDGYVTKALGLSEEDLARIKQNLRS